MNATIAEREAGVDGGGLGSQIVDHVLPILADTVFVVQRLAVEDDPRPVRAVGGIVILRTYSTDDPGRADFYAIRLWGCQGIRVGPDDWNATEHRRQCGAEGFVENTAEFHPLFLVEPIRLFRGGGSVVTWASRCARPSRAPFGEDRLRDAHFGHFPELGHHRDPSLIAPFVPAECKRHHSVQPITPEGYASSTAVRAPWADFP